MFVLHHLQCISLVLFCIRNVLNSSIISPTSINGTTEYYISSKSSTSFALNNIQCLSAECIVICDTDSGCDQAVINASVSNNFTLNCINYRSCYYIHIVGAIYSTQIGCFGADSCAYADLNLNHTENVDLLCNQTNPCISSCDSACGHMNVSADYATNVNVDCGISVFECAYTTFDVNHADTMEIKGGTFYLNDAEIIGNSMSNKLSVRCDNQCGDAHVYCPDNALCDIDCIGSCRLLHVYIDMDNINNFNLSCISQASCDSMLFFCPKTNRNTFIVYEAFTDSIYHCSDDDCCPFNNSRNFIYCPQNTNECVITCSDYTKGCEFKYIEIMNGSNTTSLTIDCDNWYYCQGTDIRSAKAIESFILNCPYVYSCRYISIDLNVTESVRLSYGDSTAGHSGDININGTSNTDIEIITVESALSGSNLQFITGNHFNLSCPKSGCYNMNFAIIDMKQVNIDCILSNSCSYSEFIIEADTVAINCEESQSCYRTYWNIQATTMTIHCDAFSQDRSCTGFVVDGVIDDSLVITSNSQYSFQTYFGDTSDFNIACADCINVQKCNYPVTPNMTFYCGISGSENSYGDQCNNCVCKGNDQVITDDLWSQCSPTMKPTVDPTLYPTTEPTFIPSSPPTLEPSFYPTDNPTQPTMDPTIIPTNDPTIDPTYDPTNDPTIEPTHNPTNNPTHNPTYDPTTSYPTAMVIVVPTPLPSFVPSSDPTTAPTSNPFPHPTTAPIIYNRTITDSSNIVMIMIFAVCSIAVLTMVIYCICQCQQKTHNHKAQNDVNQKQILYVIQPAHHNPNQVATVNQVEMQMNLNNAQMVQPPNNVGNNIQQTIEGRQQQEQNENITYQ